ncbi:hypothetical protein [Algoriphagus sp. PAP.12]|uniref:hypothetical protein n=1 Tax=Algoriphagus sp. PAP.12 TaxID=2996678 RepID=UPI00227D1763|nr:hypothetical protein [Algoriphagus sp. PAP.12]
MKRLILLFYLICTTIPSPAQSWEEWWKQKETQQKYLTEQIAALKAYGLVLKQGYETVSQGLTLYNQLKSGDFGQHKTYFDSFSLISSQVKNHPSAEKTLALYSKTLHLLDQFPKMVLEKDFLTQSEKSVIRFVVEQLHKECNQIQTELQSLLGKEHYRLNDAERISRIEQIHAQMKEAYSFTLLLQQDCQSLLQFRQLDSQSIQLQKNLYPKSIN